MIYLGTHKVGANVKYRANFHNDLGTLVDPTNPEAQLEGPDGSFADLSAPAKINGKTGHFGGSVDTTGFDAGQHFIRIAGEVATDTINAAEFCFVLEDNNIADIMLSLDPDVVVAAVLNAQMADFLQSGSVGEKINATGNTADPMTAVVPGDYLPGQVGYILGAIPYGVTVKPAQIAAGVLNGVITTAKSVTWQRGDADRLTVDLGVAYAKPDAKYYLCIKHTKSAANTTAIVNREITITDAENVSGYIDLTAEEMAVCHTYYAEIERRDADGTSNPRSCWRASWRIVQDVRQ